MRNRILQKSSRKIGQLSLCLSYILPKLYNVKYPVKIVPHVNSGYFNPCCIIYFMIDFIILRIIYFNLYFLYYLSKIKILYM